MNEYKSVPATLEAGKTYRHHSPQNKAPFRCDYVSGRRAWLVNTESGWAFWANGTRQYPDGSIEWDYSTGGTFTRIT